MRNGSKYIPSPPGQDPFREGHHVIQEVYAARIENNKIYDNHCSNIVYSPVFALIRISTISGNEIFNNTGRVIEQPEGCIIKNNIMYNNAYIAIDKPITWTAMPYIDTQILNNVIYNNGMHPDLPNFAGPPEEGVGIRLPHNGGLYYGVVTIKNNILWGNITDPASSFDAMDVQFWAEANGLNPAQNDYMRYVLENNIIQNRTYDPDDPNTPDKWRNLPQLQRTERNNLNNDPLVVVPPTLANVPDFTLQSTSPAIDAGQVLEDVVQDIAKNPRPQDGDNDGLAIHDIGAYETLGGSGGGSGGGCCGGP